MMLNKLFVAIILLLSASPGFAQQTLYAASRSGLNIREKPDPASAVLGKVPYGDKVICTNENYQGSPIQTEGMEAYWLEVSYGNLKGFAANVFLLTLPPPREEETELKTYLDRIGKPVGNWTYKKYKDESDARYNLYKTLYDNGIVHSRMEGYESHSESITLPGFNSGSGFVLARLLMKVFPDLIGPKDTYPKSSMKATSEFTRETKIMKIYPEYWENKIIYYELCEAGCVSLEIFTDDMGTTITFSGWV